MPGPPRAPGAAAATSVTPARSPPAPQTAGPLAGGPSPREPPLSRAQTLPGASTLPGPWERRGLCEHLPRAAGGGSPAAPPTLVRGSPGDVAHGSCPHPAAVPTRVPAPSRVPKGLRAVASGAASLKKMFWAPATGEGHLQSRGHLPGSPDAQACAASPGGAAAHVCAQVAAALPDATRLSCPRLDVAARTGPAPRPLRATLTTGQTPGQAWWREERSGWPFPLKRSRNQRWRLRQPLPGQSGPVVPAWGPEPEGPAGTLPRLQPGTRNTDWGGLSGALSTPQGHHGLVAVTDGPQPCRDSGLQPWRDAGRFGAGSASTSQTCRDRSARQTQGRKDRGVGGGGQMLPCRTRSPFQGETSFPPQTRVLGWVRVTETRPTAGPHTPETAQVESATRARCAVSVGGDVLLPGVSAVT